MYIYGLHLAPQIKYYKSIDYFFRFFQKKFIFLRRDSMQTKAGQEWTKEFFEIAPNRTP
jgi:hypothetical protein